MTKFGYLYIRHADEVQGVCLTCMSQDVSQSLVTGAFVSLSELLPLAAGAFIKERGN